MEKILLSSPHLSGAEMEYLRETVESGWVAPLGPQVDAFERELCAATGAAHAAALSSGTAAIHLALRALGVKPGDEVICSAFTFAASCAPILYQHARPVFVDSEPGSWNMSPAALERALREHSPKAAVIVNLYGQMADYEPLCALCRAHGVPVIEEAAESLGATYRGQNSGTFGEIAIFSFNGNKIITTSGGGAALSADGELIQKIRFLSTQARDPARHYQHSELGFNYRMPAVCAAVGRGQLPALPARVAKKKAIYDAYRAGFAGNPTIEMNPVAGFGEPNHWLSCITLREGSPAAPLEILEHLERKNIEARPIWKPMQLQPLYENYPFYPHEEGMPGVSQRIFERGLCLPSDTKMTDEQQQLVIEEVLSLC